MTFSIRFLVASLCCLALSTISAVAAEPTLDVVKKRGQLVCGVNGQAAGFSLYDEVKKDWHGMDVDLCRGVAAAVLGDASKVKFVPLTVAKRFPALLAGEVDLVVRNAAETLLRTANTGVRFAIVNYYDGQAFVVPKKLNVERMEELAGRKVCVLKDSTFEFHLQSWAGQIDAKIEALGFGTQREMYDAFYAGRCDAITQYMTTLVAAIVRDDKAADYKMLPGTIAQAALGPYVRRGDENWLDIVRWTQTAMLRAEELGINKANAESLKTSRDGRVLLLLGAMPGAGKALGLDDSWALNIVKQVGNYDEVYERNVGKDTTLQFGRGINALWSKGGLMFASPLR